jgi:hypothetical protein
VSAALAKRVRVSALYQKTQATGDFHGLTALRTRCLRHRRLLWGRLPDPIQNSAVKVRSRRWLASQGLEEEVAAKSAKDGTLHTSSLRSLCKSPAVFREAFCMNPLAPATRTLDRLATITRHLDTSTRIIIQWLLVAHLLISWLSLGYRMFRLCGSLGDRTIELWCWRTMVQRHKALRCDGVDVAYVGWFPKAASIPA